MPSNSFSGNIFFEFFGIVSLQCSCSREYPCKFSPNYPSFFSLQNLTFSSPEYLARFILVKIANSKELLSTTHKHWGACMYTRVQTLHNQHSRIFMQHLNLSMLWYTKLYENVLCVKRNILEDAFVFCCRLIWIILFNFHRLLIEKKTKKGLRKVLVAGGGGDWEPNKTKAKSTWDSFNIFPPRLRSLYWQVYQEFLSFPFNWASVCWNRKWNFLANINFSPP